MQVQFFPHRADEFRPTHSNHPTPSEGEPFGILELTNWDRDPNEAVGFPFAVGRVRDSLSVYFDNTADLDRLIEAAQALRDDMAAGREAVMERSRAANDGAVALATRDGDHTGGGPVG